MSSHASSRPSSSTQRPTGRRRVQEFRWDFHRRVPRDVKAGVPGLLASLLFHVLLILACTRVYVQLTQPMPGAIELDWSDAVAAPNVPQSIPVLVDVPAVDRQPRSPRASAAASRERSVAAAPASIGGAMPAEVGGVLELRRRPRSLRPVPAKLNDELEPALDSALLWFAKQQFPDGHWSLQGPYDDGGAIETHTGATALALLCFLGDGQTHRSGDHQEVVERGLKRLVAIQRPTGDLFDIPDEGKEAHFYAHAQATMVLCEALALTGDDSLRPAAEAAVRFLIRAQNPVRGGWRYRPLSESGVGDLSVTGWVLMALHTARMAHIEVPSETFLLAARFLDAVQERTGDAARYRYRPDFPAEESQRCSMTAEGLLCRQWLGWAASEPAVMRGVDYLTSPRCRPSWGGSQRNVYAWYYTAQTLHNVGGARWEAWYAEVASMIIGSQQRAGQMKGSWHPFRPAGAFQERTRDGGRLYLTAMCVLILETPFRHARLDEER